MKNYNKKPNFELNHSLEIEWRTLIEGRKRRRKRQIKRLLDNIEFFWDDFNYQYAISHPRVFNYKVIRTNGFPKLIQFNLKIFKHEYFL